MSLLVVGLPVPVGAAKVTSESPVVPSPHTIPLGAQASPAAEEAASGTVAEVPAPEAPAPDPPPAQPPALPDPCAEALEWVAAAGLALPAGVGYHCPSTQFAHHGAACWDESPCRGSAFVAINMELLAGSSSECLRHVVAHEVCHIVDFQATGLTTEAGADACAAAHGAPA